jgi:putative spermidine/putrescine transport system substrate-binding protein
VAALIAGCLCPSPAVADDKGSVVIASNGGRWQDAMRKAIFKPFEEKTGIKVIDVSGTSIAKVKIMVTTNNPEWDVFEMSSPSIYTLANDKLLEKIDYGQIDKATLAQLEQSVMRPDAVPFVFFAQGIVYSTRKFSKDHHPQSWADVWDVKKYPGARMLTAGTYVATPIEPALLADGVPGDKLYPLDLDHAFRSLSKIKPNITKWTNSASEIPEALTDGEADVGLSSLGRIVELRNGGAAVDVEWNQALYYNDYLAIPKGAKNYKNALALINYASRADVQAAFVKLAPASPANRAAYQLLTDAEKKDLPGAPGNVEKAVHLNAEWWAASGGAGQTNLEKMHAMWTTWMTRN